MLQFSATIPFLHDRFGRPALAVGRRRRKEGISVAEVVVTPEA